jgi:TPR repeat protein
MRRLVHLSCFCLILAGLVGAAEDDLAALRAKAEAGDVQSQFQLGIRFTQGYDVPKDIFEAVKWFTMAAENGHFWAQKRLGEIYRKGQGGLSVDGEKAVKWYRLAAERGDEDAQYELGSMYDQADCVPKDAFEAVKWFRMAAEKGKVDAQWMLGLTYAFGTSVPKDGAEAVKWLRRAAENRHVGAQSVLGKIYAEGNGVPKDFVQAHIWLNIAGAQGDDFAKNLMARVEQQMTSEQKAEAMKMARELFEKIGAKK